MNDKQSNADRIRNMSDEELAEWLTNMCDFEKCVKNAHLNGFNQKRNRRKHG